jgi:predicted phosphodiesterase
LRTLILSDLHSNLEATLACLEAARELGFDRSALLGDLVGYGGSPEEVVREMRALKPCVMIRGNHDRVVAGLEQGEDFNLLALQAAIVNRHLLSPESKDFLSSLPAGPKKLTEGTLVAHGTPLDEDEYLVDTREALRIFQALEFSICFFGHTHIPCVFKRQGTEVTRVFPAPDGTRVSLRAGERFLINPGSVGQPRDEDPRAAFLILDEAAREVSFHRVNYPIQRAQVRILEAGLSPLLAQRLQRGV